MKKLKLHDKLENIERYPFHMPGHKRNKKFGITGAEIDITEIEGFDNLHSPENILLDIENSLTNLYKSKKSFMLVNGSTVGILSAIFAVCNDGDKIIIARNCHKSVYNACMLKKLKVVYIEPDFDFENGYYTRISQDTSDEIINIHKDAKCMVITSPTYEGNISSIKTDIPLIVDAAHGAHLGLSCFPAYPSADIVISSLHKTLPALTQAAVANVYNKKYISRMKLYLDIFETSSPSYVIMNSVDRCIDFINNNNSEFDKYYKRLNDFYHYFTPDKLQIKRADDPGKIIVSTANTNISGTRLAQMLRDDFNIEVEMASTNYVILMTSVADDNDAFTNLTAALMTIDEANYEVESADAIPVAKPICPSGVQIIKIDDKSDIIDLSDSAGKISNEFVYAYPPDIPIIVPGETISEEIIDYIFMMKENSVNIVSDSTLLPDKILTKQ